MQRFKSVPALQINVAQRKQYILIMLESAQTLIKPHLCPSPCLVNPARSSAWMNGAGRCGVLLTGRRQLFDSTADMAEGKLSSGLLLDEGESSPCRGKRLDCAASPPDPESVW